jgi:hypothetical protein
MQRVEELARHVAAVRWEDIVDEVRSRLAEVRPRWRESSSRRVKQECSSDWTSRRRVATGCPVRETTRFTAPPSLYFPQTLYLRPLHARDPPPRARHFSLYPQWQHPNLPPALLLGVNAATLPDGFYRATGQAKQRGVSEVVESDLHEMLRRNPGMRILDVREESEVGSPATKCVQRKRARASARSQMLSTCAYALPHAIRIVNAREESEVGPLTTTCVQKKRAPSTRAYGLPHARSPVLLQTGCTDAHSSLVEAH